MSSSSGKSFTGMVLVVLALFGAGGALVDKLRHDNDEQKMVDPITVDPVVDLSLPAVSTQKPGFIAANLANDGTGTLAGKAAPKTIVALELDGKTINTVDVNNSGDFSVEQDRPLRPGKYVLQLKSVASTPSAAIKSDQQITLNIHKNKDIIVTFLELGQPPQVLQAVDDQRQTDKNSKSTDAAVEKSASPLAKSEPARATAIPAPSKSDQPNILFKETVYIDEGGNAGTIKLSGTAQAGAKLRFAIDGAEIGRTLADKTGAWSMEIKQPLSPGAHMLLAEQLNDQGLRIAHATVPFDRAETPAMGAKKSVWDKFSGIFKVEPDAQIPASTLLADKPETPALKTADPAKAIAMKASAGKSAQGKLAKARKTKPKSAPMASKTPDAGKSVGAGKFAFESLSYELNASGGQLELSGRGIPGSRIRLFKGIQEIGEVVADSKGEWSFKKRAKIKAGPHIFRAGHILKSGRIASEFRMQYDHVDMATKARAAMIETRKQGATKKSADISGAKITKDPMASVKEPGSSGEAADHSVPSQVKPVILARPEAGANGQAARQRSTIKKAVPRRVRRAQKTRSKKARRFVKRRSAARYYLSRKNKARYMAKRKRYPKSRRTPARVRVRNGTTLWGYSEHYYGRGRLYPHIQRANRRKIKNANKIYIGQRIRVPRLRSNRRKKR